MSRSAFSRAREGKRFYALVALSSRDQQLVDLDACVRVPAAAADRYTRARKLVLGRVHRRTGVKEG